MARVKGYDVLRHFQQYFSYIISVSFIGGGSREGDFFMQYNKYHMWTFRQEHFSPDFEGPCHQLSKSSAREKKPVQ